MKSSFSFLWLRTEALVYTEVQISVPFVDARWPWVSDAIRQQPGFLNKTWLSGLGVSSQGRFYAFDSIENAQRFVIEYFPSEARMFGVAPDADTLLIGLADQPQLTETDLRALLTAHRAGFSPILIPRKTIPPFPKVTRWPGHDLAQPRARVLDVKM